MGLDMHVFKIRKAILNEKRAYTTQELRERGISYVSLEDAKENIDLYRQILPYTTKADVTADFYDVQKIIADYDLPKNSHIGMMSYDKIIVAGTDANGDYIRQEVTREEIEEKYILTKTEIYYIWKSEEVAYWRKHYDLQDWIYDVLGNVENTKYCYLDEETIKELNDTFDECIPVEPDLFYWEWY